MDSSETPPQLCRNCQRFFGNAQTSYLCSQCFKTIPKPQSQDSAGPEEAKMTVAVTKCGKCGRKLGLTTYQCKCGGTFCMACRQAEAHECRFDFRAQGIQTLAKSNPVVTSEKVTKI